MISKCPQLANKNIHFHPDNALKVVLKGKVLDIKSPPNKTNLAKIK